MSKATTYLRCFLLCSLLSASAAVVGNAGYAPQLEVDPATGLPAQIIFPQLHNPDILVAPVKVVVQENGRDIALPAMTHSAPDGNAVAPPGHDLKMAFKYGTAEFPYLEWEVDSAPGQTGTVTATFTLALRPAANQAFFPAGDKPRFTVQEGKPPVTFSYGLGPGIRTAMPLGQVYSVGEDWGLAFFGEFGERVEDFSTSVSRTGKAVLLAITLNVTRPLSGKSSRRLYFAATKGDWRPALGAVLARFPKVFEPGNPDVSRLHGPFVDSNGTPPDSAIEDWYGQGARLVDIHVTFPFYGQYVAQDDIWTPLVDDSWHFLKTYVPADKRPRDDASWQEIKHFVEQRQPPTMTVDKVNDYIERLHRHGMKCLLYFNPTEAWAPWAADKFPTERVMTAAGKPVSAWYESVVMNPDKRRPWGKYLLDQIRGQMRIYPAADGVFFDMAASDGHDLTEFCAEACRLIREKGKICWWNGPYNIERAALADGMMTEGGGSEAYRQGTELIQYFGLAGKPIVALGAPSDKGYAELLVHGVIPPPVGMSQNEIRERWFPLFAWLRNRRWELGAGALTTSAGVVANLFRVPNGNLVVPVAPDPATTAKSGMLFDIKVTVKVADAGDVRGVYLLAPDLLGYHKLPFVRTGDVFNIVLPRLGSAGLLVLAKEGIFPALEGDLEVVRGREASLRWRVDNWTKHPREVSMAVGRSLARQRKTGQVDAGASLELAAPMNIPSGYREDRLKITTSAVIEGVEKAGMAELWIDPPLRLSVEGPTDVRDDEEYPLVVTLVGHLLTGTTVDLKAESPDWRFEGGKEAVVLTPDRSSIVRLKGHPLKSGETLISIVASGGDQASARVKIPVQVLATEIPPSSFSSVRSAELLLDVFGVDGGVYAHKPVTLNGVRLGDLPLGDGDQWAYGKVMPLPEEAVKALRPHNEIAISNGVKDVFKVRNTRLILHMRGGGSVVSTVDSGVYTAGSGWLYGEGQQSFPDITGISVDIRVNANRMEKYDKEVFGVAKSARLVMEINGSYAGVYAHKQVTVNGLPIGDLPLSGEWANKSMAIPLEVLATLGSVNEVLIENSNPPGPFKVRNIKLEVVNTEERKYVSETEQGPYTSVGWAYQEGVIGSPIRFSLRFRNP